MPFWLHFGAILDPKRAHFGAQNQSILDQFGRKTNLILDPFWVEKEIWRPKKKFIFDAENQNRPEKKINFQPQFRRKCFKIGHFEPFLGQFLRKMGQNEPKSTIFATFLRNLPKPAGTGHGFAKSFAFDAQPRPASAKSFAFDAFAWPKQPKIGLKLRFSGLFWPLLTQNRLEKPWKSSLRSIFLAFLARSLTGEHNAPLIRFAHEPPLAACARMKAGLRCAFMHLNTIYALGSLLSSRASREYLRLSCSLESWALRFSARPRLSLTRKRLGW